MVSPTKQDGNLSSIHIPNNLTGPYSLLNLNYLCGARGQKMACVKKKHLALPIVNHAFNTAQTMKHGPGTELSSLATNPRIERDRFVDHTMP